MLHHLGQADPFTVGDRVPLRDHHVQRLRPGRQDTQARRRPQAPHQRQVQVAVPDRVEPFGYGQVDQGHFEFGICGPQGVNRLLQTGSEARGGPAPH